MQWLENNDANQKLSERLEEINEVYNSLNNKYRDCKPNILNLLK